MTGAGRPPDLSLTLEWDGGLRFRGACGDVTLTLDSGPGQTGPNPVQALAFALAGCMSMDVAEILRKGRHPLKGLQTRLVAERAPAEPRRLVSAQLHFVVAGAVPPSAVERALQLSRDKYCSVLHTLRGDLDFGTSYELQAG